MATSFPCQGLPDRPCPRLRCDDTVHNTIYDLFLCDDCERAREIASKKTGPTDMKSVSGTSGVTASTTGRSKRASTVANTTAVKPRRKQAMRSGLTTSGGTTTNTTQLPTTQCNDSESASGSHTIDDENNGSACPHCLLPNNNNDDRRVKCDICQQYYHQQCTSLTAKIYDKFIVFIDITGWVCDECKTAARYTYRRLETAIAHLAQQVASLQCTASNQFKGDFESSSEQQHAANVTAPKSQARMPNIDIEVEAENSSNEARTMLIVQRTINDSARRKRNIIITGLPEQDDGDDRSLFLALCEEQLPMKPAVVDKDCIRLGKKLPGRSRRLLVKLNSEEAATKLLRAAPMLRNSTDQYIASNVYINADLSPTAAQLAYEARKTRREAATRRRTAANSTALTAAAADTSNNNNDKVTVEQSNNDHHTSHAAADINSCSQTVSNMPTPTAAPLSFRGK
jgi:hypothetical protein